MQKNSSAKKATIVLGSVALLAAPLLTFIGWGLAHDSLGSFFSFNFTWTPTDAAARMDATSDPEEIFRYYLLPHYFIYASMPVYIGLAMWLGYMLYRSAPWHSLIGVVLSVTGAVYFIGVLGAFLSAPIGTTDITPFLIVSFVLSILVFAGNLVLGFALHKSRIMPRWASVLFIVGNLLILVFPGTENWMALGSLFMLAGLFPLSIRSVHSGIPKRV
jgi:hypothetical protein